MIKTDSPLFANMPCNTTSKSKMLLRRLGGSDEAYYTYVEETDNDANKNSALIYEWNKRIVKQYFFVYIFTA